MAKSPFLTERDIDWIVETKEMADYFQACMNLHKRYFDKRLFNFFKQEVRHVLKKEHITIKEFGEKVPPINLLRTMELLRGNKTILGED